LIGFFFSLLNFSGLEFPEAGTETLEKARRFGWDWRKDSGLNAVNYSGFGSGLNY
jgi:hypothetical protein